MTAKPVALRRYLWASHLIGLLGPLILRRRLKRGKEHPDRWREKLGEPSVDRPSGPLIWLHAVGLGELLSIRGLIDALLAQDASLTILATSTTRQSAAAFERQSSDRVIHQFLPLDAPKYRRKFLNYWTPDAAVWVEQDLWPGLVADLADRNIPQALVAARMNAQSFARHEKLRRLYEAAYAPMQFMTAQDDDTARHLAMLSGKDVVVSGSMKPAAAALSADKAELKSLRHATRDRRVWLAASTYDADHELVFKAHKRLLREDPDALLIVAPRQIANDIEPPFETCIRSSGEALTADHQVYVADTTGEMGLFLRLAQAAYIGGGADQTGGHNPWEAVALGVPVLHAPNTANFKADYAALDADRAAISVRNPNELAKALLRIDLPEMAVRASAVRASLAASTRQLGDQVRKMMASPHG